MAKVLGIRVDILRRDEAEQKIRAFLELKSEKSYFIVTANAELYYQASRRLELRETLNSADLCVPDSVGIIKALRRQAGHRCVRHAFARKDFRARQGIKDAELYPGVELAEWILRQGYSVYVLGAADKVLNKLQFPNIVGKHHGYFNADEENEIIAEINRLRPQVVFAALGAGRQELWLSRHRNALSGVLIGVGGAIDVLSGHKRRAPKIFRRLGLEWFYRLLREPSRLSRQINLVRFWLAVLKNSR